jgi:hypothetical protein
MKTLKSIMMGAALVAVCGIANAAAKTDVPLTEDYTINTYINATTKGDLSGINTVVDNDAKFSLLQDKKIVSYTKQEELAYLKSNKDVRLNCSILTKVVESNLDNAVMEVDMKYNDHTRADFVTMINTNAGWKITDVYSIFK